MLRGGNGRQSWIGKFFVILIQGKIRLAMKALPVLRLQGTKVLIHIENRILSTCEMQGITLKKNRYSLNRQRFGRRGLITGMTGEVRRGFGLYTGITS